MAMFFMCSVFMIRVWPCYILEIARFRTQILFIYHVAPAFPRLDWSICTDTDVVGLRCIHRRNMMIFNDIFQHENDPYNLIEQTVRT